MTSSSWDSRESFLSAFHRDHPGLTAEVFTRGRTDAGMSSYELLAEEAAAHIALCPGIIVELGCGDGYLLELLVARRSPAGRLIGIDLSAHELARARGRQSLAHVPLVRQRAQALPLADGSAGVVLAHLSLMLMGDLVPVLAEVARVLRPGGVLSAIIGGGPVMSENAYWYFVEELSAVYGRSSRKLPPLGDPRLRTDGGLAELFSPESGFASVQVRDVSLHLDGTWEEVWSFLSSGYEPYVLSADDMTGIAEKVRAQFRRQVQAGSPIPCTARLRHLHITRNA